MSVQHTHKHMVGYFERRNSYKPSLFNAGLQLAYVFVVIFFLSLGIIIMHQLQSNKYTKDKK